MVTATRSAAERLWLALGGLVALLLLVLGYFLFIGPQRSDTDGVNTSLSSARAQNAALETRIAALRQQSRKSAAVKAKLAAAQQALPSTSGLPDFLRTLQSLGTATSTRVVSLSVGTPTDVTSIATGTGTTGTAVTPSSSPSATPSSSATTGTTTGTVTGGASVYGLTITAQVTGSPAALNTFLHRLQTGQPRAVLITQIGEGSGLTGASGSSAGTTLQLTMQAFVAPGSATASTSLAAASGH